MTSFPKIRTLLSCMLLSCAGHVHAAPPTYDGEDSLFVAAVSSPYATREVLRKVFDACTAYDPDIRRAGDEALANWAVRNRAYLDENRRVREELVEMSRQPQRTEDQRQRLKDWLEVRDPQAVDKEVGELTAKAGSMPSTESAAQVCRGYIQAVADGKLDLKATDPALAAYFERRIGKRENPGAAMRETRPGYPTAAQVSAYYAAHPELFSNRRIYTYHAVGIKGSPEIVGEVKAMVDKKRTLAEIAAWARDRKLQVASDEATKPAERIPLSVLPRLAAMKNGQILLLTGQHGVEVILLKNSTRQPVDEATATPAIEAFLMNPKSADLMKK